MKRNETNFAGAHAMGLRGILVKGDGVNGRAH